MAKAYSEYTIADVLRLRPTWFLNKQERRTVTETHLNLLHSMMEYGFAHIAPRRFIDVFGDYDISGLTPQLFNKAIMTYTPPVKKVDRTKFGDARLSRLPATGSWREAIELDTSALRSKLHKYTEKIRRLESAAESHIYNMKHERSMMEHSLKEAKLCQQQYETLQSLMANGLGKGPDRDKIKVIQHIPKHWSVVEITTDHFWVLRTTPVHMAHMNARSGMSRSICMGYFAFKFSWDLYPSEIIPVADYIFASESRHHPHLSGGTICWGNMDHRADEYAKSRDSRRFFELLDSVMETYCDENPYIEYGVFEKYETSKHVSINPKVLGHEWFMNNQREILSTIAETASDRLLDSIDDVLTRLNESRVQMYHTNRKKSKEYKADSYAYRITRELETKERTINNEIQRLRDDRDVYGVSPKELLHIIRNVAGIKLPDARFYIRSGLSKENLPHLFNETMAAVYEIVPSKSGLYYQGNLKTERFPLISHFSSSRGHRFVDQDGNTDRYPSYNHIYYESLLGHVKSGSVDATSPRYDMIMKHLNEYKAKTEPLVTPTPVKPALEHITPADQERGYDRNIEEDEECDHEWDCGECIHCGEIDHDYDNEDNERD